MKNILIVSSCSKRGNSIGLIGDFINKLNHLDNRKYTIDLCNLGYFQTYKSSDYHVHSYYSIEHNLIDRIVLRIPKIRSYFSIMRAIQLLKDAFNTRKYDLMIVYSLPTFTNVLVEIAHNNHCKTLLYPWGANDIIDKPKLYAVLYDAFQKTDYSMGLEGSNCTLTMQNTFKVHSEKLLVIKPILKGIKAIDESMLKYTRKECEEKLNIPTGSCNIICGYNAFPDMLHQFIIESFCQIKEVLPENLLLIFPMTYPKNDSYIYQMRDLCQQYGFNNLFITDYLTDEQVACLHRCSDYFINIQHADSGNAFQIEELYCGSQTITGKWLKYSQFEKYGIPYYKLNSKEDLPSLLEDIFLHKVQKVIVPKQLKDYYAIPKDYSEVKPWEELLDKI